MDKVIGLGKLGCAIAEELTAYPEYRIYTIDGDIDERGSLSIGEHGDMASFEANIDIDEASVYLRSIKKKDQVLLIVEGGDPISGAFSGIGLSVWLRSWASLPWPKSRS